MRTQVATPHDQEVPAPTPSIFSKPPDSEGKFSPGNTWLSPVAKSVDKVARADRTIEFLERCIDYQMTATPECTRNRRVEAAKRHRRKLAVVLAFRVMRNDLSWNRLRRDIREQNEEDINELCGTRIFPTMDEVRKIWKEIYLRISVSAGVQTISGENGEVGWWPIKDIIRYFLDDEDLRSTCDSPILGKMITLRLEPEAFRRAVLQNPIAASAAPMTIDGPGSQILTLSIEEATPQADEMEMDGLNPEDERDTFTLEDAWGEGDDALGLAENSATVAEDEGDVVINAVVSDLIDSVIRAQEEPQSAAVKVPRW